MEMIEQEELDKFDKFDTKCRDALAGIIKAQDFWREALSYGIDIPWSAHEDNPRSYGVHCDVAQYGEYDRETGRTPLDVDATKRQFARVIKFARSKGYKITKNYEEDQFEVILEDTPIGKVTFASTRQVVCEKVVVGTKVIPATPEKEEPVYEYKCDKVAFLNIED